MTSCVDLHPQHPLAAGRYLLDSEGRLHPERYRGFIRAVAVVMIRPRAIDLAGPSKVRQECAQEARQREESFRTARKLTNVRDFPASLPREIKPSRSLARKKVGPAPQSPPQDETEIEDAVSEFERLLAKRRADRAAGKLKLSPTPKVDASRLARALAARPHPAAVKACQPTRRAMSDGECHKCGTRTRIGCEHFLPYEGEAR